MQCVADELALKYKQNFIGHKLNVLVELDVDKVTGMRCGYTERYVKVVFNGDDSLIKRLIEVTAKEISNDHITGEINCI